MAVRYSITQGDQVFAATAGAKTVLLAIAPAGHGLLVAQFSVSTDGVTASAVPAVLEMVVSTQAGAGTPAASTHAAVVTQTGGRSSGGQAPTAGCNSTAEPTVLTPIRRWFLPQFMGLLELQFRLEREDGCDSSGGGTLGFQAIGLRINVSAAVTVIAYMQVIAAG